MNINNMDEKDTDKAQHYFDLAQEMEEKGDNKVAFEYYAKALELNPQKAEYYLGRGLLNAKCSVWTNAVFYLQKAIDMGIDDNPECYFQLGRAKDGIRDFSGANLEFGRAERIDPAYKEKIEVIIQKSYLDYNR